MVRSTLSEHDFARDETSERRATITDVARLAEVSIKTVSRVINRDATVGPRYREAVERAVAQLGYRPNISARALAGQRSYLISLMFMNPNPGYVSLLQRGAMRACRSAGFHLVLEEIETQPHDVENAVRRAVAFTNLDGIILSPPLSDDATVMAVLDELKVPFVRISPNTFPERRPSVTMDDHRAAYEMTAYLWDRGHRDIAFVAAPPEHAAAALRRDGFMAALADRGAPVPERYVVQGDFTAASGLHAGQVLLDLATPPTAVFAANDEMAAGVMIAAYQRGLSLPQDLSVTGFDDSPVALAVHPLLTTIRQPTLEMAKFAACCLIDREQAADRVLDFELVVRDSVGPGPAALAD